jgi:hypothetical protein
MVTVVRVPRANSLKQNAASNSADLRCAGLAMNLSQETYLHHKLKYLQKNIKTFKIMNNVTIHLYTPYIYTSSSTWCVHCIIYTNYNPISIQCTLIFNIKNNTVLPFSNTVYTL